MILIEMKERSMLSKKEQPNTTGKIRENLNRSNTCGFWANNLVLFSSKIDWEDENLKKENEFWISGNVHSNALQNMKAKALFEFKFSEIDLSVLYIINWYKQFTCWNLEHFTNSIPTTPWNAFTFILLPCIANHYYA